jgi:hypothetical protein
VHALAIVDPQPAPGAPRPRRRRAALVGLVALGAVMTTAAVPATTSARPPTPAPARTGTFEGTLPDGATWTIDVPADWNGTLLLYGHGLVPPGQPNPAEVAPDPVTREHLVDEGFALAGSSYASTGMAVAEAVADQLAVLDVFAAQVAAPTRTVAWGSSLGGLVTALLLERHADRVDGGLSLCGPLAGGVGLWNTYLDALFVLSTLLETPVRLVDLADPDDAFAAVGALSTALDTAQATPQGRARIALAAAVMDLPGWLGAANPRPARDDLAAQEAAQYEHLKTTILFGLVLRADQEARIGGNPSTNAGVDYGRQLRRSSSDHAVRALYRAAGLSLAADLARLAAAPRITADPAATARLHELTSPSGAVHVPMVTLHTNGDQLATVEHEQAFGATVHRAGSGRQLRQLFTERAGHCTFTPAEIVTALDVVLQRMDTGAWPHQLGTRALDRRAAALGPDLNVAFDDDSQSLIPVDPAFSALRPGRFLR